MQKSLMKLIITLLLVAMCLAAAACDIGGDTEKGELEAENAVYTEFEDKLYFKGVLYSRTPSLINTTFYFPILSNERVDTVESVELYNGQSKINGTVTVIPDTRDDKVINENLYLNVVEFQLNIENIEGIKISRITLEADGKEVSYDVDIRLHYYYVDPEYNLTNQGDMLLEYDDSQCTLIYGYASPTSVSRFDYLESMVEGIEIVQLRLADGDVHAAPEGKLPWEFREIRNDGTNGFSYKSNVLKIKCDFSEISKEAVFFKDVFRACLSVERMRVDIMLPEISSNSLIELYATTCREMMLEESL